MQPVPVILQKRRRCGEDIPQTFKTAETKLCLGQPSQYFDILALRGKYLQSKIVYFMPGRGKAHRFTWSNTSFFTASRVASVLNSKVYFLIIWV
jgi:hypothetical protein